jgi:hypothetical protein
MKGNGKSSVGEERNILKGLVAGVTGGLIASFVMDRFQYAWIAIAESLNNPDGRKIGEKEQEENDEQESATVKAAFLFVGWRRAVEFDVNFGAHRTARTFFVVGRRDLGDPQTKVISTSSNLKSLSNVSTVEQRVP